MNALTLFTRTVIGLTLLVPLIVLPKQFLYPFIVPKVLLFRSLVEIMLAAWIILAVASRKRFSVRWTPISILVALFLFSFALSTVAGVDRYRSLWDTHERMLGLFTVAHYIAFYFVVTSVVREWRAWRVLFRVLLGVTTVVMGIACVQKWAAPNFLYNLSNQDPNRVSSTLGHPAYLGGLGSFTVLLAIYLAARDWRERRQRGTPELPDAGEGSQGHDRIPFLALSFALVAGSLGLVGVVLSETRGSLVGLSAGLGCLMLCYAFVQERGSRLRTSLFVLLFIGILGAGTLYSLRNWDGLRVIPGLRRFHGVSLERETARTRVMAWGIALEAASERPVLGWGPNNYYYAFNKHYRPRFLALGFEETWWDNAHNVLLNVLAMQGAVGLLIYVGLLCTPPMLLWKAFRRGEVDPHTASFASAFMAMHLVSNLFVFENPSSWLYFVLVLAFLDSALRPEEGSTGERSSPPRALALLLLPVVVAVIWLANIEAARANMAGLHAVRNVHDGRNEDALAAFETSSRIVSPHIDGVRHNLLESVLRRFNALSQARAELQEGRRALPDRRAQTIRSYEEGLLSVAVRAYDELGKNASLHPLDVRVPMGRATLALKLANTFSEAQLDGVDRVLEAEKDLLNARPNSPRRQEIQYLLAALEVDGGFRARRALRALRALETAGEQEAANRLRTEIVRDRQRRGSEAIALLEASIASAPEIADGWWRLALVHRWLGDAAKAQEVLAEALRQGVEFEGQGKDVVEQILESR